MGEQYIAVDVDQLGVHANQLDQIAAGLTNVARTVDGRGLMGAAPVQDPLLTALTGFTLAFQGALDVLGSQSAAVAEGMRLAAAGYTAADALPGVS